MSKCVNGVHQESARWAPIRSTLTARSSGGLNILTDPVVANAVVELKTLVQAQMHGTTPAGSSSTPLTIVERLAYRIDEIRHSQARACVVWLVGQYAADDSPGAVVEGVAPWAPDVLRKVAKSFRDEVRCCRSSLDPGQLSSFADSLVINFFIIKNKKIP